VATADGKFFDERTDESEAKARIIEKYFATWANVILATSRQDRIAYIDLYAGPGRYKDGSASTPLLVLERAIAHKDMPSKLVTLFNDADGNHTGTLQTEINKLPGINTLKYPPVVRCGKVDEALEASLAATQFVPAFTFVDPWGYKGLSLSSSTGSSRTGDATASSSSTITG
jgi:three-Cys-motif partner protein